VISASGGRTPANLAQIADFRDRIAALGTGICMAFSSLVKKYNQFWLGARKSSLSLSEAWP
jgi:hypothetical protein